MRNEGPFIVEWVTWYRMLGFSDVVVVTNNCTDRSPELLDALQAAGWVHHIRCDVPAGKPITKRKLQAAKSHKAVRRAQWVLVCDVDEFLVIHRGAGLIGDLIDLTNRAPVFLGMSINWKVFGTSGHKEFQDVPVHRQFVYANPTTHSVSRSVKSIFRLPRLFEALGEHGPLGFDLARFQQPWGAPGLDWVTADGRSVPRWQPKGPYMREMPRNLISHDVAQINHYMLRSCETYSLKAGTLSPVALSNRYQRSYFDRANKGAELDPSAFVYGERFEVMHAQAMALPGVTRLHALCCADHVRLIREKAGKVVDADPRYGEFLAQADHAKGAAGFPTAPYDRAEA